MRADQYLVSRGHYESRARAQAAIKAGRVTVNGRVLKKPSDKIPNGADVQAEAEHPWVSRGGLKLAHALSIFDVPVDGRICLDVGASTGGFTDVLLNAGAEKVYAVDVGHGQLHSRIAQDCRVVSMEGQDARLLEIPDAPEIIVCDASFISAMKVLETPLRLGVQGAHLITLVKPQFEVGRRGIGKGGIVKSEDLALQALENVKDWVRSRGWTVKGTDVSPIRGGSGNTEYLLWAQNN